MSTESPKRDDRTDGSNSEADTVRLPAFTAVPDAAHSDRGVAGDDPYNKTFPPVLDNLGTKRRGLDDMRRLSEMIKAKRSSK